MKIYHNITTDGTKSKTSCLRLTWISTLGLSFLGWLTVFLFLDATSTVGEDGVVHEPLGGLVPLSMIFLLFSIVLAIWDVVRLFWHKKRDS